MTPSQVAAETWEQMEARHAQERAIKLAQMTAKASARPSMREIAATVAEQSGLTVDMLKSPTRRRAVSRPRQKAFYLCRQSGYSTTRIGNFFGGRHHTTVLHGLKSHMEATQ